VANGTSCGTDLYCDNGACATCTPSAGCVPAGKPCDLGTTSCSGGTATCTDTTNPAPNGTSCGTNEVCLSGACVSCTAMLSCNPTVCTVGQTSCATGTSVCNGTGNVAAGTTCGTNMVCASGACACAAGYTSCSGTCVDFQTDAANCGRCGHSCLYGTCSAGVCQPWVVVGNYENIGWMDSDGKYVVWSPGDGNSEVYQISVAGETMTSITPELFGAVSQPLPGPVFANGTVAYLTSVSSLSTGVYTVAEGQTNATMQASVPSTYQTVGDIAINPAATTAYLLAALSVSPWTNYLLQCPLNGQACTPLGPSIGGYVTMAGIAGGGLIVNGNYAFWSDASPASLKRYTFTGSATTSFTTTVEVGPKLDANNVYWVGDPGSTIYALPQSFSASSVPQNMGSSTSGIVGLSSDGTNVYFGTSNLNAPGSLSYIPVGGTTATPMFTSSDPQSGEFYVVAAGGAVYWVDADLYACPSTATIMGIATP
jgi:hypothetical protein